MIRAAIYILSALLCTKWQPESCLSLADSPVSVALMQVNERPKPPREPLPEIPAGVESMIMTAMDKDPAKRFQSASAMLRYVARRFPRGSGA